MGRGPPDGYKFRHDTNVKKKNYEMEAIPVHQQRLFFDGKLIEERQILANYSIQEKSTIETTLRSPQFPWLGRLDDHHTSLSATVGDPINREIKHYW